MNCKLWIANLCEKSDINGLIGRMELQEYYNASEAFERGVYRLRLGCMQARRSLHGGKAWSAWKQGVVCKQALQALWRGYVIPLFYLPNHSM